jgi:hypothetical protein
LSSQNRALLIDVFAKFLIDPESEVRNICCLNLDKFVEKLGKDDSVDKILKQLKTIENDSTGYVRGNLKIK